MTAPYQNYFNDQLTSFDTMLSQLKTVIGTGGGGTTDTDRSKVLFFVTDGVGDSHKPSTCTKTMTRAAAAAKNRSTRLCQPLKNQNIKIAILYTTYLPLPKNGWYNTWIAPFQSQISTRLQSCASPGLYFEVSPTQGVVDAMNALFLNVIRSPRLTG